MTKHPERILSYVLTATIIGTLLGAAVTYAFLIPRIDQLDSGISELETTLSNLDERLSVIEEYLSAPFSMQVIPDHMEA